MTVIRTATRERLTEENRPGGCPASSAGMFVLRADGTARFDRHYHDIDEFWFIAAGDGTVVVGDVAHQVGPGDIVYTAAGLEHDITEVGDELRIFWLSWALLPGATGAHRHRTPADAIKHQVRPVRR